MNALIEFKNLSRQDKDTGRIFFHPCSHYINTGDRILLNGVSGAGKSVFMRALALLDQSQQGEIYFESERVTAKNASYYRSQVAYVRQQAVVVSGTVEDNIRLPWILKQHQGKVFDKTLLAHYLDILAKPMSFLEQDSADLSGGEQQLCCLLRVLMLKPRVLLLDEPTSALDTQAVQRVETLLQGWFDNDKAWVWISHDEEQKQRVAHKYWNIHDGEVEFAVDL
ncbi:ABC transporter ATP-binding protein [Pelistega europaea]|uniref:ATP-binding cassette domain-containing protein n=1 Tax=Pelistega europaea TaxID=106147 RepID=A0A7Y4LDA1_9BURK|nr:ATP-binding cassette domain-containing protein [Pelistega europaea]NOL50316.1 ATP-binding cassette domain-containing protein [Pelistega europaea]